MDIEEDCFGSEKFSPETIRAFLLRNDTFVLIADLDREGAAGSAMCMFSVDERLGRIASIAVLRRFRRQGIATKLLDECERILAEKGVTKFSLEVETINEPAIALYTSKGYETKGVLQDFYGFGRHAYCMEKKALTMDRAVRIIPSVR
jgi:ribosomal-protein-alanine N-acetyltransferase